MRRRITRKWIVVPLAGLLLLVMGLAGCNGDSTIAVGGSTTVQPLAEKWRDAFEAAHENVDVTAYTPNVRMISPKPKHPITAIHLLGIINSFIGRFPISILLIALT